MYKDQWPQPWPTLCVGPIKAIIEQCQPLQACDQVGCQCPCWHGLAGPRDPESILELWGRNFTTLQFRPSVQLPGACSASSDTGTCHRCCPHWFPPGHPVKEEMLHNALRSLCPFHAGPLPYGVQRHSVAKAFKGFGWPAKPLHTVLGGSGDGLWWVIQASSIPPSKVRAGPIQKAERLVAADTVVAAKATFHQPDWNDGIPFRRMILGRWLEQNGRPRKVPAQVTAQVEVPKPAAATAASLSPGDVAKLSAAPGAHNIASPAWNLSWGPCKNGWSPRKTHFKPCSMHK